MKKYISAGIILLSALALAGCKKSGSSSSTKPSLDGLAISQVSNYVAPGTTLTFKAGVGAITASDGANPVVGLYWQVNSAQKDTTTLDVSKAAPEDLMYEYTADTLGSYVVYCYAFSGTDYYVSSAASSFRAIDSRTALTGISMARNITVKGTIWNARDISHATLGRSYRNSPILDDVLGKLFTWEEAMDACPEGWHLPTVAEFEASFADEDGIIHAGDLMADASFLESRMWEYWKDVQINNQFGFNALPIGYIDDMDSFNPYGQWGEYAMWWTADQSGDTAAYMYIFEDYPEVRIGQGDKKSLAMSVRCVKD